MPLVINHLSSIIRNFWYSLLVFEICGNSVHLAEERPRGLLRLRRHVGQELAGVQTRHLHKLLRNVDDAGGSLALEGLGFERLDNEGKALGSFGQHNRILPIEMLVGYAATLGRVWTYCSIK